MRAVVIKDMFCRGSILCCALLLCCLCLWPAGARALSSDAARACVVEAGGAVDNADAACFEQLVDMDAILNEAVDLFMKEPIQNVKRFCLSKIELLGAVGCNE